MGIVVDGPKALELLAECVKERGKNYVYCSPDGRGDECLNWHHETNKPGCIVGMALHKLGFTATDLGSNELNCTSAFFTIDGLRRRNCIGPTGVVEDITPEAVSVFKRAQAHQDQRSTWGHTLEEASDMLANLPNDKEY